MDATVSVNASLYWKEREGELVIFSPPPASTVIDTEASNCEENLRTSVKQHKNVQ
jgi:hypothetical protein